MTSRSIFAWLGVLAFAQLSWAAPLRVDVSQSRVTVDVRATGHSFEVALTDFAAEVEIAGDGSVERADFRFDPKALDSDNDRRDRKLREWIEETTYPEARFQLRKVTRSAEGAVGEGTLTLHGVTKEVEVPFTLTRDGKRITLQGQATIDHRDFGLGVITVLFLKVNPELNIHFKLVGELDD